MRRDIINVMICGLLAQITGFIKLLLIARYFGISAELDGYYLALAIPALIQGFITGAIQTGFVPVYISLRSKGKNNEARTLAAAVFYRLFLFLFALSLLLSIFSENIIDWLTPTSTIAVQQAAITSLLILAFSALLNGLIDYFSLLLNAHHRYVAAALGPAINAIVASSILFMWPEWGINNLILGLMIGMLLQLVISLLVSYKSGIRIRLLSFIWRHASLGRVYQLTLPILLGVALANANNTIIQFFAATIGDGGVSILGYANRLHGVFLQVVIMGVSAVLLPNFASLVAEDKRKQLHVVLQNTFRMSLLIGIVMVIAISAMGADIVTLLLQRGRFDQQATENVTFIWLIYTFGLFPIAWGIFISKYIQAVQKPWIITRLAVLSFIANTSLAWVLLKFFGLAGLAAASGIAYLLVTVGFHWSAVKELGIPILKGEGRRIALLIAVGLLSWLCVVSLQPLLSDVSLLMRLIYKSILLLFVTVLLARLSGLIGNIQSHKIFG